MPKTMTNIEQYRIGARRKWETDQKGIREEAGKETTDNKDNSYEVEGHEGWDLRHMT